MAESRTTAARRAAAAPPQAPTAPRQRTSPETRGFAADYFGHGYHHLYSRYLIAPEQTEAEVAGLLRLLRPRDGQRWLDVPCAYGRHWRELRRRRPGLVVCGADLNRDYLAAAAAGARASEREAQAGSKAPAVGQDQAPLASCDMRRLPFAAGSFHVVLNLLNSFGYFGPAGEREVLAECARVLRRRGRLVLDLPNRRALLDVIRREPRVRYSGGGCQADETFEWDAASQSLINVTRWRWPGGSERGGYRLRLYTPAQLTRLLERAGFELLAAYGDFRGGAFYPYESDRLLLIAEKR